MARWFGQCTRSRVVGAFGGALLLPMAVLPITSSWAVSDAEIASVQQQVADLQRQAAAAAEKVNDATLEWQQAQQAVVDKQAQLVTTQQQMVDAQTQLDKMAGALYRSGGVDPDLLLLAEQPSNWSASWNVLQIVARQQNHTLQATEATEQQLKRDEAALQKAERKASTARDKILSAKAEIDRSLQESTALLSQLQQQQQLELQQQLQRQQQQQQQQADEAQQNQQDTTVPVGSLPASVTKPVIKFALDQVGKPFEAGATGPDAYDSSGLTMAAWEQSGVKLPHSVQGQFDKTQRVDITQLAPGDLVFVYGQDEHVGIYTGDGFFVHAADPREGVKYEKLFTNEWMSEFAGAGRPKV